MKFLCSVAHGGFQRRMKEQAEILSYITYDKGIPLKERGVELTI